jgi:hypothetical protein
VKYAFNLEDYDTEKVWKAYETFDQKRAKGAQCFKDEISRSMLFQRTGAGFSTFKIHHKTFSPQKIVSNLPTTEISSIEFKKLLTAP